MIGLLKTAKRSGAYWDAAIKYLDRQTDPKLIKEIINAVNPQMENLFEGKPFVAANRYENIILSLLIDKGWRMVINLCLSIEIAESEDEKFFICDSM